MTTLYKNPSASWYYADVLVAIAALEANGAKWFRIEELAAFMNRRPTSSMRRALAQAEADGRVYSFHYATAARGTAKGYAHALSKMERLPGI